jgi:hypothetical protein
LFSETLARFRIDPKLATELAAIEEEEDYFPLGGAPLEWLQKRILGVATAGGECADICSSEWISRLRKSLAAHLSRYGVEDIDAAVLKKTAPRTLTQFVSRIVFYAGFSGIHYLSKYVHDIENWTLFEPFQIDVRDPETVRVEDPVPFTHLGDYARVADSGELGSPCCGRNLFWHCEAADSN